MQRIDVALLVLRVSFGLSMSFHGINKVRGNGLKGTAGWFGSIGMKWPRVQAVVAACSEIVLGGIMMLGLLLPLACIGFIALMTVAIVTVHWKVGYFIFLPNGGWEYCASIIAVSTALGSLGAGKYSLQNITHISDSLNVWVLPIGFFLAVCHLTLSYRPVKQAGAS
jgi:putative oxidoreductase